MRYQHARVIVTLLAAITLAVLAEPVQAAPVKTLLHCTPGAWRAQVDPEVAWGQPFSNHLHEGIGNTSVSSDSTLKSMLDGDTTCKLKSYKSGIWVPALMKDGVAVTPALMNVYYIGQAGLVRPFPDGSHFIIGDHDNTTISKSAGLWACVKAGNNPVGVPATSRTIPTSCPSDATHLSLLAVYGGQCWDGKNYGPGMGGQGGPANGRDHFGTTASSQPEPRVQVCDQPTHIDVPVLLFSIRWPLTAVGGRLASDDPVAPAGTSFHLDYVPVWDFNSTGQLAQDQLVDRCLNNPVPGLANGAISCQEITGADGVTRLFTVGPSPVLVTD